MAAVGRHLPSPCLLLILSSLLLLVCLDGEAAEEGGGLRPSSPGDNGDPTGPLPVPTAGKRKSDFTQSHKYVLILDEYFLNKGDRLVVEEQERGSQMLVLEAAAPPGGSTTPGPLLQSGARIASLA